MHKGGSPKHEPTEEIRQKVRDLATAGFSQDRICKYAGVSEATLKKHYEEDLRWHETALSTIAGRTLQYAMTAPVDKATAIIIFILKTRLGWRETDFKEAADKLMDYVINAKSMTLEEWKTKHGKKKPS